MGIKFLCPNGHKLNVKGFLSGRRAICPKCGVSLVVPKLEDQSADGGELVSAALAESGEFSTSSVALAELPARQAPASPGSAADAATSATADPIGEAPSAVWYVRPATGGQFGPASGDVMRAWLKDGRVGASSLVWRAGWGEWRSAAAVFPQLAGMLTAPGSPAAPPQFALPSVGAPVASNSPPPPLAGSLPAGHVVQSIPAEVRQAGFSPSATPPLAQVALRRRRQREQRLYVSAVLVVLSVILLIVLVVVFQRQGTSADPQIKTPDPPAAGVMS
ncbi:MAG: DUF4339 domain-containing protein [Pirellulales bacterium]